MGMEVVVSVVVGALLRLAQKVGDGALKGVEEQAQATANGIVSKLRSWWADDEISSSELDRFDKEPDLYRPIIEARLVQRFLAEPNKRREFEAMTSAAGPYVEVLQNIAEANGVTGARIEDLVRGTVHVE